MRHPGDEGVSEVTPRTGGLLRVVSGAALVLLLPLAGAAAAGRPLAPYLQFPPKTPIAQHAPFSLPVFAGLALLVLLLTAPNFLPLILHRGEAVSRKPGRPFPWWGWTGLGAGGAAWVLAWGRFPWMEGLQAHTFTPLWVAYIAVVNAFTFRRTGRCLFLARPRRFLLLFPASAAYWWTFEYLNRFVGNWYYLGVRGFGAGEYFLFASLPFSTVLPAVLSTRELLLSFPRIEEPFREWRPLSPRKPRSAGGAALLLGCAALFVVGIVPDAVFPLVWVAPPLILISLAALRGERNVLSGIAAGDWRLLVVSSLAALCCGFFWEMWNFYSYPKWIYYVPFFSFLHIFEMPLLGYFGYLPFSMELFAMYNLVIGLLKSDGSHEYIRI